MNEALRFYNQVYQEFPTERLLELMELIASNKCDHWRGFGYALNAITQHSKKADGLFSLVKYERNRARLEALKQELAPDTLFQV